MQFPQEYLDEAHKTLSPLVDSESTVRQMKDAISKILFFIFSTKEQTKISPSEMQMILLLITILNALHTEQVILIKKQAEPVA